MTKQQKHRDRMAQVHAEARAIVATGVCPDCGTALRRNLGLHGWWQCDAYGHPDFRRPENRQKPDCAFQCFTD